MVRLWEIAVILESAIDTENHRNENREFLGYLTSNSIRFERKHQDKLKIMRLW